MTKTHISNYANTSYKINNLYNHKGFIHWNKNKKYTGESWSSINPFSNSYKIYDLIDKQGFIYYEVYKLGLSKNKKEFDNIKDILLLTTYNYNKAHNYMTA